MKSSNKVPAGRLEFTSALFNINCANQKNLKSIKVKIIELMSEQNIKTGYNEMFYRLTALWVVCEAFAGGIMHGIKIPFSGMIVSSLAIICITLIAYHVPIKGAILKATIIVAIFKLLLSPHSPPTAYMAVFFQGLMGQILFSNKKAFTASAVILSVLALVESAIQRILVLIVIYGNNFWKAVNEFLQKVLHEKTLNNYSAILAIGYIIIHVITGLFVGYFAAQTAIKINDWKKDYPGYILSVEEKQEEVVISKKKSRMKIFLIIIFIFLAGLYIQSKINPSNAVISGGEITDIIIRAMLILLCWYLIAAPILLKVFKYFLAKQKEKNQAEIKIVSTLLPETKNIFSKSLQLSSAQHGIKRIKLFVKILLINILA